MNNGSTWNRWELHMHTPFTKKEDQFNILKDEKEKYTDLKLKENPEYKYDQFEHKWNKYISEIREETEVVKNTNMAEYFVLNYYIIKYSMKMTNRTL